MDLLAQVAQLDNLGSRENVAVQEKVAFQDRLDLGVREENQDHKEVLVQMDVLENQVFVALEVNVDNQALQESLDNLEKLDSEDLMDQEDNQVREESEGQEVQLEQLAE